MIVDQPKFGDIISREGVIDENFALYLDLFTQSFNDLSPSSATLTTSSTTTVVADDRMNTDKTVIAIPTNSDAVADMPALTAKADGSFTWTHSSDTTTRTFDYVIVG